MGDVKGDGCLGFFFKALQKNQAILDFHISRYRVEPIRDDEDFKGATRNVQNSPKQPNGQKRVVYVKRSLDALFYRLIKRLVLFWHPHMSGYLMEPIINHEDFQGVVRNVQKGKKLENL